jgi:hypothetical protein
MIMEIMALIIMVLTFTLMLTNKHIMRVIDPGKQEIMIVEQEQEIRVVLESTVTVLLVILVVVEVTATAYLGTLELLVILELMRTCHHTMLYAIL